MSTHEDYSSKHEIAGPSDRSFGWVFAVFFVWAGVWPRLHGRPLRPWALGVALAFAVVTLMRPALLHPLNIVWMKFGLLLGKLINPIVMALLFYGVITPMAWLMRTLGKRPLALAFDRDAPSYWLKRTPPGPKPETMSQQF